MTTFTRRIPAWKHWLSYLHELHIESAPSDINPHLYVSLKNGKLLLGTENAVYSYEDRYDNFRLLFNQIDLSKHGFERVLLLGLGLGSVPLLIEKSGMNASEMVLVEIDEQVIYLAEKYGLVSLTTPYTIFCADAQHFIKSNKESFDLIISDVFLDDKIPEFFNSVDYLLHLKRVLHPGGLLIINTLASTNTDKRTSKSYFEDVFKTTFPEGELRHVWENYMLLNRRIV